MIWIIAEALLALALLVGIVLWVMLPQKRDAQSAHKKRRDTQGIAPLKPPEREEK